MEMNKEDEMALEQSINDWKDKARGINNMKICPLCILAKRRDGGLSYEMCSQCIIKKHTGFDQCHGTPYWPRGTTPEYYKLEIEFLESLRPEKKVKKDVIEVGDKVSVHDNSWAYTLSQGKAKSYTDMRGIDRYIVVDIRIPLPETYSHGGQSGNNVILYDPNNNDYIFTREKYLKLVPKLCPECGKAE